MRGAVVAAMPIDLDALAALLRHDATLADHPLGRRLALPSDRSALTAADAGAWWARLPDGLRRAVAERVLTTPAEWRQAVTRVLDRLNASPNLAAEFVLDPIATMPRLGYAAAAELRAEVERARGRRSPRRRGLPSTFRNLQLTVPGAPEPLAPRRPTRTPPPTNPLGDFDLVVQLGFAPALHMVRSALQVEPLRFGTSQVLVNRPIALTAAPATATAGAAVDLTFEISFGPANADPATLIRLELVARLTLAAQGVDVTATFDQLITVRFLGQDFDRASLNPVIAGLVPSLDLDADVAAALAEDAWGFLETRLRGVEPLALPAVGEEVAAALGLDLSAAAIATQVAVRADMIVIAVAFTDPVGGVATLAPDLARVQRFIGPPGELGLGVHERVMRHKVGAEWNATRRGRRAAGYDGPGELVFGEFRGLQVAPGRLTVSIRGRIRLGGDAFDWLIPDLNFDADQIMAPVVDPARHVLRLVPLDTEVDVDDDDVVRLTLLFAAAAATAAAGPLALLGLALEGVLISALATALAVMVVPAGVEVIGAGADLGGAAAEVPIEATIDDLGTLGAVGVTAATDELLFALEARFLPPAPTLSAIIEPGAYTPPSWTEVERVDRIERRRRGDGWQLVRVRRTVHRRVFPLAFQIVAQNRQGPSAISWQMFFEPVGQPAARVRVAAGQRVGRRAWATPRCLPPRPGLVEWRPVLRATVGDAFHTTTIEYAFSPVWGADDLIDEQVTDVALGDPGVVPERPPGPAIEVSPTGPSVPVRRPPGRPR
jgi:hypothetical protein